MPLDGIKHIILVLSGKGGVGKSSITTQLALTLSLQGHSVGVLDIDLTGPSIPRFFGVEDAKVTQAPGGLVPVTIHEGRTTPTSAVSSHYEPNGTDESATYGPLSCMSLGFILSSRNTAVIWRGPKKTAMVRQFLTSTLWPDNLDYLLIDTPPGTSDEHISVFETLQQTVLPGQLSGAVVVTTPQAISISDVKKELNFCKKVDCRVLGVVENMAGFVCPNCSECTNIFSRGGGEVMAKDFGVRFLGSVPIDPAFVELVEEGKRPSYPQGTVVAGMDLSRNEHSVDGDDPTPNGTAPGTQQQNHESDTDLLVEKYTSCSLYPIFDQIVKQIVDGITHSVAA